ncbi:MAG: hypothetical protein JXB47_15640 [Anaerolineae bacterium]|nr:hypothetical protein [Anaerolineae bacterium]
MIRRLALLAVALLVSACGGAGVIAPTRAPTTTPAPTGTPTTTVLTPAQPPTLTATPPPVEPTPTVEIEPTVFIPVSGNPTVPPDAGGVSTLALSDLPMMPDALTTTPGDRFSIQTTPSAPAEVEDFYVRALAEFGVTLADREEGVTSLFGSGLLLHFGAGAGDIYVMIVPAFEGDATGVLLTLEEQVVR